MTLNGVMAVTLRYFTEVRKPALQKTICGGIYAESIVFLVLVQCRRKESSRSLSHLLMSFLLVSGRQKDSHIWTDAARINTSICLRASTLPVRCTVDCNTTNVIQCV